MSFDQIVRQVLVSDDCDAMQRMLEDNDITFRLFQQPILTLAVTSGCSVPFVKLLLHHRAPMNAADRNGRTALHNIVSVVTPEESPPPPERAAAHPSPALSSDILAAAALLLGHGADALARDSSGFTAADLAERGGFLRASLFIRQWGDWKECKILGQMHLFDKMHGAHVRGSAIAILGQEYLNHIFSFLRPAFLDPRPIGFVYKLDGTMLCTFREADRTKTLANLSEQISEASGVTIAETRLLCGEMLLEDVTAQVLERATVQEPETFTVIHSRLVRSFGPATRVATVAFEPEGAGEVALLAGDVVEILHDPDEASNTPRRWVYGLNEGSQLRGWFPLSHTCPAGDVSAQPDA